MESAKKELGDAHLYDHQVWSLDGGVEQCVRDVEKLILERARERGIL